MLTVEYNRRTRSIALLLMPWLLGPLLLTWFNFNPSMKNDNIHYKVWEKITHPFPNLNGYTIEVWDWIDDFIPHLTDHVSKYPCPCVAKTSVAMALILQMGPWQLCVKISPSCAISVLRNQQSKYHGCWCTGSLCHQDISTLDIDYVE